MEPGDTCGIVELHIGRILFQHSTQYVYELSWHLEAYHGKE